MKENRDITEIWMHLVKTKKTDVAKHPEAFNHVGLLVIEPPGRTGLLFI